MPVQGKGQIDSGGKLLVDSSGKAMADSASNDRCCCRGACDNCIGAFPSRVRVTLSGISLCPGCRTTTGPFFFGSSNVFGTPPQITMDITEHVDPFGTPYLCSLFGSVPYGLVRYREWNTTDCSGAEVINELSQTLNIGVDLVWDSNRRIVRLFVDVYLMFPSVLYPMALLTHIRDFPSGVIPPCGVVAGTFANQHDCVTGGQITFPAHGLIGYGGTALCEIV